MPITYNHLRDFLRPGTDELDQLNAQREAQRAAMMCGGDDSDGDTVEYAWTPNSFVTATLKPDVSAGEPICTTMSVVYASANAGWEGYYAMPYDAPAPVDNKAVAAKAEDTERKGQSLMQAIGALQEQCKSDGRPPRFTIVE